MIRHIVMLKAEPTQTLLQVMDALQALTAQIDGFTGFEHGPNADFEGKSPEYPYGFVCTFADNAAVTRYADDPRHQVLGGQLVALCEGGAGGIMVYDLRIDE